MKLALYSTDGCHLCEQAYSLIEQAGIASLVEVIDIAFDDELFSRYGVTIPVVAYFPDNQQQTSFTHSQNELGWPFDYPQLIQWLNSHGIINN
ncbi:glutaredoxin family protein [Vibrio sp. SS-MA-C1-2]|uniref:glutaredoxin family protein n=1 Tax=Vibrio sp. SS-MA-C1-2 TaxID=2908646 RepID=UPI001F3E3557|nr:glutaredoxin family protein [Vibrio sp. SS-MA-C1-2]UJF18090.1 glutaredoxin family protein [Vibrio sp. SS-MA-C1-2]